MAQGSSPALLMCCVSMESKCFCRHVIMDAESKVKKPRQTLPDFLFSDSLQESRWHFKQLKLWHGQRKHKGFWSTRLESANVSG
ncbi:hypothetical protein AOLI_G00281950 [Acnodon oligacanthus]